MRPVARLLLLCLILSVIPRVFAVRSLTITGDKGSLLGDDELTITASASGFTEGETVYIKGAFFSTGSSNYFGFTKNGDIWIKNSASNTSQRPVVIGSWDGALKVKTDFSDSGYSGEGDYNLKVGFYYGSASSVNWSENSLAIGLNEPDLTPTLTSTPTPVPTSTPTATTPVSPSVSSTPTPTKKLTQTPTPIPTLIDGVVLSATASTEVAHEDPAIEDVQVAISSVSAGRTEKPLIISLLLISSGLALLSGVLVWRKHMLIASQKTK